MTESKKPRVVVAMSGGVDSSVAAALLLEQGYEVIGMMMRLWSEPGRSPSAPLNRCCTPDQMADARRVADMLNIPFYVVDVQDYFRRQIVQFFIDEHAQGRTPNPCIECNREIRFHFLYDRALALEADYLATGHYARIRQEAGGYQLWQGLDEVKDQSYVLHLLSQEQLAHLLFPVGEYSKVEVRQIAARFGLPVAQKKDSMDLCFLGDGDYRRFLHEHAPQLSRPGPILSLDNQEIGQHEGLASYTIGQRKGLDVPSLIPLYVLSKDSDRNALIVGSHEQLGQSRLETRNVNWISGRPPQPLIRAQVKIRYKAKAVPATVMVAGPGRATVTFDEPVFGVTAGQGAIFYDGQQCLGGGIIDE